MHMVVCTLRVCFPFQCQSVWLSFNAVYLISIFLLCGNVFAWTRCWNRRHLVCFFGGRWGEDPRLTALISCLKHPHGDHNLTVSYLPDKISYLKQIGSFVREMCERVLFNGYGTDKRRYRSCKYRKWLAERPLVTSHNNMPRSRTGMPNALWEFLATSPECEQ